jgi:hypothetical protein
VHEDLCQNQHVNAEDAAIKLRKYMEFGNVCKTVKTRGSGHLDVNADDQQ